MSAAPSMHIVDELSLLQAWVNWPQTHSVIELGCGGARVLQSLLHQYPHLQASGLEVDRIQHQKNMLLSVPRLTWVEAAAQAIPSESAQFDGALMLKSLHHVPMTEMDAALQEVARVVRAHGWLFVAEPVYSGALNEIMRLFNDEGEVRAHAIAAIDRAVNRGVWQQLHHQHFDVPVAYQDFTDFEDRMLRPTYLDKTLSPETKEKIRHGFEAHMTAQGVRLTRPMQAWLLQKRAS